MKKAKTKTKTVTRGRKLSRADKIAAFLGKTEGPQTTREICKALHLEADDAKFVSSILIAKRAHKDVLVKKKICSITGRKVNAFALRA